MNFNKLKVLGPGSAACLVRGLEDVSIVIILGFPRCLQTSDVLEDEKLLRFIMTKTDNHLRSY